MPAAVLFEQPVLPKHSRGAKVRRCHRVWVRSWSPCTPPVSTMPICCSAWGTIRCPQVHHDRRGLECAGTISEIDEEVTGRTTMLRSRPVQRAAIVEGLIRSVLPQTTAGTIRVVIDTAFPRRSPHQDECAFHPNWTRDPPQAKLAHREYQSPL